MDCLRLATEHRDDFAKTMRCRAQACAMMRQEKQALRTLAQMQAARKAAAVPALAAGASQHPPPAAPQPEPIRAADDLAPPGPAPQPDASCSAACHTPPEPALQPDLLARAEAIAIEQPVAAAQIRC